MEPNSIQAFAEDKVNILCESLKQQAEAGYPRYYEIRIDEIPVVPRTNDHTRFNTYLEGIFEDSKILDVLIYQTSRAGFNGKKHRYILKEEEQKPVKQELSGNEVHSQINAAIIQERERMNNERTREELEKTKAELKEAQEYIEKLEEENTVYKSKKMLWGNVNLAEALGLITEGVVRRNTHIIAQMPGGKALAGIIEEDNKQHGISEKNTEDAEVTFVKSNGEKQELTADQQKFLQIMTALEENFDDNELMLIMQILERLLRQKENLKTIADLLEISQA